MMENFTKTELKKYLVADKSVLESIVQEIDTQLGLPNDKATTYGTPFKHPNTEEYALLIDAAFYSYFSSEDLETYGVLELNESWINNN